MTVTTDERQRISSLTKRIRNMVGRVYEGYRSHECGRALDMLDELAGVLGALPQAQAMPTNAVEAAAEAYATYGQQGGLRAAPPSDGCIRAMLAAAASQAQADGWKFVPIEPVTEQLRALLKHRGYDPDAKEDTLDAIGNLDIMTMGAFSQAYRVMVEAAPSLIAEERGAE